MRQQAVSSSTRAIVASIMVVAVSGCGTVGTSLKAPSSAAQSTAPEVTHVPTGDGGPNSILNDTLTVALEGETNGVASCAGSVWVAVGAPRDAIVQINPSRGRSSMRSNGERISRASTAILGLQSAEPKSVTSAPNRAKRSIPYPSTPSTSVRAGGRFGQRLGVMLFGSTRKPPRWSRSSRSTLGWT